MKKVKFEVLQGKTVTSIKRIESNELGDLLDWGGSFSDDCLHIQCNDNSEYAMCHHVDCCEDVYIEDINGELGDLVGYPLLMADEVSNSYGDYGSEDNERGHPSYTWAFYKLATIKGYVTIRWYGGSNGYYSEEVNLYQLGVNDD